MAKRLETIKKTLPEGKTYSLTEGVGLVKKNSNAKFDETIELHIRLGINPKQTDQQVRGTVLLPHGTGRAKRVAVIAKGEKIQEARSAGADEAGAEDLIEKIAKGFFGFDVLVATPDAMKDITKLGKILGPKGLMPNPKSGTVTFEVSRAVKELKTGRVGFKADDYGILHLAIGKVSFPEEKLSENIRTVIEAVAKAKPAAAKGVYLRSITLCSTMGPGVRLDASQKF